MLNALTIDIEDYFQVQAFSGLVHYDDWDSYESRVERNTRRILKILSETSSRLSHLSSDLTPDDSLRTPNSDHSLHPSPLDAGHSSLVTSTTATFFCLGWIAKRYPRLIKEIQAQGHEVACHGFAHRLVYRQSPEEFRKDIRLAKSILEDITGEEVIGYRAPSYSITENSLWALEILAEEGFKYDSSIFPIRHDFYGIPDAPRFPFVVSMNGDSIIKFSPLPDDTEKVVDSKLRTSNSEPQTSNLEPRTLNYIVEFPLSTVSWANLNWPIAGGGYFRILPYAIFKRGLKRIRERESRPFIFYLHPWEMDFEQPRIKGAGLLSRFRHYVNLDKTENRFKSLLKEFDFCSIKNLLNPILPKGDYLKRTGERYKNGSESTICPNHKSRP
ncbi:MAG: DUF3473 domain-containing protein [Syntrophales bacterium LBB04]|nr:DUF3473 domain-containing protein [Syntrophales bacterium LBB04]